MPVIASILQLATRGSNLSLALYDFAASVPSSTTDASNLARASKDLSRALWQVSASQREDARITTPAAKDAIADIAEQCGAVFTEIEAVVPLDMMRAGKALPYGQKWEWSEVSRAKVQYLLGHLESLKLTLEVLSQAIRSVKVMEWAEIQGPSNPTCVEAMQLERMQLESLIVEQQLSFLHASQLFDGYHKRYAESGLELVPFDPNSHALTLFEPQAPNPTKLRKYQDEELLAVQPAKAASEAERLAMIRRTSSPYIDFLLERWTRYLEIRRSQQPAVDSDESSDDEESPVQTHSNGSRGPMGPILTHIDEELATETPRSTPTSPMGIPERLRRPRGPMSPTSPNSWSGRAGSYFPATSAKPNASTPSSPRVSFEASSTSKPNMKQSSEAADGKKRIKWRLRLGQNYWDHENEKVIDSNTKLDPSQVPVDRNSSTDILAMYVSEEIIEDLGYRYDRVTIPRDSGGQTKLETLYCIRHPLTYPEVEALVERSARRWELRYKKPRPQTTPTLDRSFSSPLPNPGAYLETPKDYHRSSSRSKHSRHHDDQRPRSSRSSASNTSEDDRDGAWSKPESRSSKSGGEKRKGSRTASNLSKVAAGAGFAALLEGLFEAGSSL